MTITPQHDQVRTLVEVAHYEAHPDQKTERRAFEAVKDKIHKEHRKCFIDNGRCEGNLEVHHSVVELSMANGIDWAKVKKDYPNIEDANDYDQMQVLCAKHHRSKYYGVHNVSYNIWIAQKYMTDDALDDMEKAADALEKKEKKA